jgi:hypothetical protein
MELEASLYHASDHNLIMNGIMSNGSKNLGTSSAAASSSPESEETVAPPSQNVSARRRKVQYIIWSSFYFLPHFLLLLVWFSPFFLSLLRPRPALACFAFDSIQLDSVECKHWLQKEQLSKSRNSAAAELCCVYTDSVGKRRRGGACHRFASFAFLKKQDSIINKLSKKKPSDQFSSL